jgi:hypothetical protein
MMGKGADYTVKKKEEVRRLTETGDVEFLWRIWATSKGGTYFHIDVPEDQFDKADELLTAKARKLDAI